MDNKTKRGFAAIYISCIILGIIVRIAYCIKYPVQPRDAFFYESIITQMGNNGVIEDRYYFFPLSLLMMQIPYKLFCYDIIKGGTIINFLTGVLLIILIIKTTSLFTHKKYLLLAAGLTTATHPTLVKFSCCFLRENTYLLFSQMSLFFFLNYYIKASRLDLLVSAFCGALAFLCRLEGVEILVYACLLMISLILWGKIEMKKAIVDSLLFVCIYCFSSVLIIYLFDFKIVQIDEVLSKFNIEFRIA